MWAYYGLILLSVVMFGGGFALQDVYRKMRGSGLKISMESACIGSLAGLAVLLIVNGFSFACTPFTFLMATWAALNGMAFTFCAFKALDYINLSLFSVFTMLGGMVLPFFQGILFFGEGFTWAKGICVFFICLALFCTVEKGEKKKGAFFYAGVFLLNGMSGVITKLYTVSPLPKAGAAGYSIWIALMTALLSGGIWLILLRKDGENRIPGKGIFRAYAVGGLSGAINKVGNFLLVIALAHVDASVQYPMVTGGTMIVSTLLSCLGDRKPRSRELLSVVLAFAGMLALFLLDE